MAEITRQQPRPAHPLRSLKAHARQRRRLRRHALFATLSLIVWLSLLNALLWRFPLQVPIGRPDHGVSDRAREIVSALTQPLEIDCVIYSDHPLFGVLRARLTQYREGAGRYGTEPVRLRFIDPRRDVRLVESLQADLAGATEAILMRYGNERRRLLPEELVERRVMLEGAGMRHETTGYLGDAVLAGTLWNLITAQPRKLYLLEGHGERRFDDYDPRGGYSDMARLLRRQGYDWESLSLARRSQVPADASALLWIGPRGMLTRDEQSSLRAYLNAGGRLLALLDAGVRTGIEPLLAEWNVYALPAIAEGRTITGDELVVIDYGSHPVTRSLRNTLTLFARPSVLAVHAPAPAAADRGNGNGGLQDRPQTTILAGIGEEGWYQFLPDPTLTGDTAGMLRRGPAAVAVALERGGSSEVRVHPTRMVVIGDSRLADNGMLALGAPGNRDLFLNALGWLTDYAAPSPAPDAEPTLQVVLPPPGWTGLWLGVSLVVPGAWLALGVLVLSRRRRVAR